MSLRILLLQARTHDDPARVEEIETFAERCRLPLEAFCPANVLDGVPSLEATRRHDAIMVGGSGDFYVSKGNLPNFPRLLELLTEVVEVGHPMFASCFGFQCLTQALGGEIIHDPENTEVGTFELTLTGAGAVDPLFGSLPATFRAQLGRKDRATALPAGSLHLAASERCPFQAFRLPRLPVWASQFHPELNRERNLGRFFRYLDGYAHHMTPEELDRTQRGFLDSPETEALLPRFLELVFA